MTTCTVHWCKSWGGPILPPAQCSHGGPDALTIRQRLEPKAKGGGYRIAVDGDVCMACGIDTTGNFTVAEALRLCMDQHGWNREVGLRLHDLAAAHEAELMQSPAIPLWCLHAFGWSGKEIVAALNAGTLLPTTMSEQVEDIASEIGWRNAYDRKAAGQ